MKDKLLLIFFWSLLPLATIYTAHLAIEKHSIYFAMLALFNCNSMASMIISLEKIAKFNTLNSQNNVK